MSEPTPEEILALARFCWPAQSWSASTVCGRAIAPALNGGYLTDVFDTENRNCVAAAEAILIERGLGEEYARKVALILRREDTERPRQERREYSDTLLGLSAPLDARVRAMVAVVRAGRRE